MIRNIENIVRHAEVSEKALERYLEKRCRECGLPCLKYSNQLQVGYPDRVILLPDGYVAWVELKSTGCRPTKMQELRMTQLRRLGHQVWVADSRPKIDELIELIRP